MKPALTTNDLVGTIMTSTRKRIRGTMGKIWKEDESGLYYYKENYGNTTEIKKVSGDSPYTAMWEVLGPGETLSFKKV